MTEPMETEKTSRSRRDMIKLAFGSAAVLAVAGCAKTKTGTEAAAVRGARQYGMIIDRRRCVGCKACTVACKAENRTPPGLAYNVVDEEEGGSYPNLTRQFRSRPCQHCAKPSCVPVCPVDPDAAGHRATWKREEDGIVVVDYDRCIGCGECVGSCPYQARTLDGGPLFYNGDTCPHERLPSPEYGQGRKRQKGAPPVEKARKCTFCLHRVTNGLPPACAATCMGKAIHFGDLNDPEATCLVHGEKLADLRASATATRFLEDKRTEPSVYYLSDAPAAPSGGKSGGRRSGT